MSEDLDRRAAPSREETTEREPPQEPSREVTLGGPLGWLLGLVTSFLLLGVRIGIELVQGILRAFTGGRPPGGERGDDEGERR